MTPLHDSRSRRPGRFAQDDFFVTGVNSAGDPVFDVFSDMNDTFLKSVDLTALGAGRSNLHSIAVDPLNGDVFVPVTGGFATLCPGGCIAVFAQTSVGAVPEPAPWTLIAPSLMVVGWLTRRRRSRP